MITLEDYFRKPHSKKQAEDAEELLARVTALLIVAQAAGVWSPRLDPDTGTLISGERDGDGDGGFRTPGSRTGSEKSKHRLAQAVDIYDPDNGLDNWITDERLAAVNLYREHPTHTPGWCHLQSTPPGSGKRTYIP